MRSSAGHDVGQQSQGRRLVVDEDAVAAGAADLAAHHQLLVAALEPGLLERRPDRVVGAHEGAGDGERLGVGADEVGRRARAGEQRERVDDDRLAGARLAGQDVPARLELDARLGENGEVLDVEMAEHVVLGADNTRV